MRVKLLEILTALSFVVRYRDYVSYKKLWAWGDICKHPRKKLPFFHLVSVLQSLWAQLWPWSGSSCWIMILEASWFILLQKQQNPPGDSSHSKTYLKIRRGAEGAGGRSAAQTGPEMLSILWRTRHRLVRGTVPGFFPPSPWLLSQMEPFSVLDLGIHRAFLNSINTLTVGKTFSFLFFPFLLLLLL